MGLSPSPSVRSLPRTPVVETAPRHATPRLARRCLTFRWLSVRHATTHRLRTILTITGIAFGVAAVTGTSLLNVGVARSYEQTVDRLAGKAVLQLTNEEAGVPEDLLDVVRSVPGVSAAEPSVQGFLPVVDHPGERLYVFGLDLVAEQKLRDYDINDNDGGIEDPLVFLAQPDSIAVTPAFLRSIGLQVGDRLSVRGGNGQTQLTVRGALDFKTGAASLFGGRLAVMDVFAAQRLFGLDRRFSQIDVGVDAQADVAAVERALTAQVGTQAGVARPRARTERFEHLLAGNRFGMFTAGVIATLVGAYLTFNTMMIAVMQRRREIGILRCVGMRARTLFRLFAIEALLLGLAGSVLGVPLGYLVARVVAGAFGANVSALYLRFDNTAGSLPLTPAIVGLIVGPLCALLAALMPIREAVGVAPREAVQAPAAASASGAPAVRRAALAGVLVLAATAALWFGRDHVWVEVRTAGGMVILGTLVGLSLFAPAVVMLVAPRLERPLGWMLGPIGTLAGRNVAASVGRVAVTSAAFVVSLGGAITIATMFASIQWTVTGWIDSTFGNVDLLVTAGAEPFSPESRPFPARVVEELATLPGVVGTGTVRYLKMPYGDMVIHVVATNPHLFATGAQRLMVLEGDEASAIAALESGQGAVVNEFFARAAARRRGSTVVLRTPAGPLSLPVVAVVIDSDPLPVVYLGHARYREQWFDDTVTIASLVLAKGTERDAVADAIRRRWADDYELFVITAREFREEQEAVLRQLFHFLFPLTGLALAIALLGVTNSLLASLQDRTPAIGVLRAVGATRGQVLKALIVESGLVGLIAGTCAVVAGSLVGYGGRRVFTELFDMSVLYRYPVGEAVGALAAAVILAAAVGYIPGRQASRVNVRSALTAE